MTECFHIDNPNVFLEGKRVKKYFGIFLLSLLMNLTTVCLHAKVATLPLPSSGDSYYFTTTNTLGPMVPANLDGDNILDWVGRSNPSAGDKGVKVEARKTNGDLLWIFDMNIPWDYTQDNSGFHEPSICWDIDNDGIDEVITIRLENDTAYIVALDGPTGTIKYEIQQPGGGGRSGNPCHNLESLHLGNHYACIAYLDGLNGNPYVLVSQGTYRDGAVWAFDLHNGNFRRVWTYQHHSSSGTGSHGLQAYDITGDGKDEVIFGGTVLNSNGKMRFTLNDYGYGHVDLASPGDLNPNNSGIEIFYGVEAPYTEGANAALMVNSKGKILWKKKGTHFHAGFAANIRNDIPGAECRVICKGDKTKPGYINTTFSAAGVDLNTKGATIRPPEWTGDNVYDINIKGRQYAVDVGGGPNHGAEERIYRDGKNVQIQFNLNANDYPSRWANKRYRQDVSSMGSGYNFARITPQVREEEENGSEPASYTIEAEVGTLSGFEVKTNSYASGSKLIKATGTGTAKYVHSGSAGTYDIRVYYFDENDGVSKFILRVDGVEIDSWIADQDLGSNVPSNQSLTSKLILGVTLSSGSLISIEGVQNAGEYARTDKIELRAVSGQDSVDNGSDSTPASYTIEAEVGTLSGFEVKTNSYASGSKLIKATGTGTAKYVHSGSAGTYDIRVYYFDENDGVSKFILRVDGVEIDSWIADQDLGSSGPSNQSLTSQLILGVTLSSGSLISIEGVQNAGEHARTDKIELRAN